MDPNFMVMGFLWYLVFIFSTTCHEAAHAVAARIGGDETAALGGQATLNPVPHMQRSPFGMILIPVLMFAWSNGGWMLGWASAPYDVQWQQKYPHRAAWMALAGPAANMVLAFLAAVGLGIGLAEGWFLIPEVSEGGIATSLVVAGDPAFKAAAALLSLTLFLNILLAVFNLFPAPPLDGAIAIGLLFPEKHAARLYRFLNDRTVSIIGLLMAWVCFGAIFRPIFYGVVRLLYSIP